MKRRFPAEFFYQVFALIIAIIVVHAIYVTVVRPRAAAVVAEQALRLEPPPLLPVRTIRPGPDHPVVFVQSGDVDDAPDFSHVGGR